MKTTHSLAAFTLFCMAAGAGHAQSWPSQPIHIIVPYAAGGGTDTTVRTIAPRVAEVLGQPVVVENRPGGATIIATEAVYRAEPDGYTVAATAAPFVLNAALGVETPYDPLTDFAPVIRMVDLPFCVLVNVDNPATTFPELLDWARAQGEPMLYASAGIGSMPHLWMESFALENDLQVEHVGYRGSAPALLDVIAGNIDVMIEGVTPGCLRGATGEVRVLGLVWDERSPLLPDVPTLSEVGFESRIAAATFAIVAPSGTDPEIVGRLNAAFQEALDDADVQESLAAQGLLPAGGTPEDLAAFFASEVEFWSGVVEQAGISPE
ncbi:MAG: tripartite tricarboxylate transporter substrate binding protein [Pararhodobacter sp.]|nr:tripartite tricarboxylate transporter substrate binding protein [Pararhodobacter sp.]